MLRFLIFFLVIVTNIPGVSTTKKYETNFRYNYQWGNKNNIDYVVYGDTEDTTSVVQKLVEEALEQIDHDFPNHFNFTPITATVAQSIDRYFVFVLADLDCGYSQPLLLGPNYIELSKREHCSVFTNIRNILYGLGFVPIHKRQDSLFNLIIKKENIRKTDLNFYTKLCQNCGKSEDIIFSTYDFNSIMMICRFNRFSKNTSEPVIQPSDASKQICRHYQTGLTLSETDIAIVKAIYKPIS